MSAKLSSCRSIGNGTPGKISYVADKSIRYYGCQGYTSRYDRHNVSELSKQQIRKYSGRIKNNVVFTYYL